MRTLGSWDTGDGDTSDTVLTAPRVSRAGSEPGAQQQVPLQEQAAAAQTRGDRAAASPRSQPSNILTNKVVLKAQHSLVQVFSVA